MLKKLELRFRSFFKNVLNPNLLTVYFAQMMALLFLRHAWIASDNDEDEDDDNMSAIFSVSRNNLFFLFFFF